MYDKMWRKTPLYGRVKISFFRIMVYIPVTVGVEVNFGKLST